MARRRDGSRCGVYRERLVTDRGTVMVRRYALVGCGKSKLDRSAPARDLYTGLLFKAALAVAEAEFGEDVWILSAKHDLDTALAEIEQARREHVSRRETLTAALDPAVSALYERQHAGGGECVSLYAAGARGRPRTRPGNRHLRRQSVTTILPI